MREGRQASYAKSEGRGKFYQPGGQHSISGYAEPFVQSMRHKNRPHRNGRVTYTLEIRISDMEYRILSSKTLVSTFTFS